MKATAIIGVIVLLLTLGFFAICYGEVPCDEATLEKFQKPLLGNPAISQWAEFEGKPVIVFIIFPQNFKEGDKPLAMDVSDEKGKTLMFYLFEDDQFVLKWKKIKVDAQV